MSKEKLIQTDKKVLSKEVAHQMELSLGKLKEHLGEKKFKSRLKKAIKILTEDIDTDKKEKADKATTKLPKEKPSKEPKKTDKVLKGIIDTKISIPKTIKAKAAKKVKK